MRKIALTFAAMAVLFITNANAAWGSDQGSHVAQPDQNNHHKGQQPIRTALDAPILTHHLQNAPVMKTLGATSQDSSTTNLHPKPMCNGDCENFDKTRLTQGNYDVDCSDCQQNDWGCDVKSKYARMPTAVAYTGTENQLMTSYIPAQTLTSNVQTVTTGNFCQDSAGARHRNDTEAFEVSGNFRRNNFDCQEQMVSEATCFVADGTGQAAYISHEGMHPVDACDCNTISSSDMLDFEQDCDCHIFNDERHQPKRHINVDPETDVEHRINKQIEKSISDILSEIIQNALQQSMEDCITFS